MTSDDILTSSGKYRSRPVSYPPTRSMLSDAVILAQRVTQLLLSFAGAPAAGTLRAERTVNSGYRPPEVNDITPNAAPNSNHEKCEAADVEDHDGKLAAWCLQNLDLLEQCQLWIEDPRWTRTIEPGESKHIPFGQSGWVHFQILPPPSGHRVFIPYNWGPP